MRNLFLLAVAVAALAYVSRDGRSLDGSSWAVRVKPDSFFSFSRKDTLVFDSGRLTVAGQAAEGFSPASYRSARGEAEGAVSWQASLESAGRGVAQWQGVVREDRIEGDVVLLRSDGKTKRYRFEGRRV